MVHGGPQPASQLAQPLAIGAAPAVGSQPSPVPRPPFAPAPADPALAVRITKLAEYTARNGPAFEAQVRAKQAGSQEYTFLFGGEGTDFYRWCLFCSQRNIPTTLPLPDSWVDSTQGAPVAHAMPSQPSPAHGAAPMHPQVAAAPMQQFPQHQQPPVHLNDLGAAQMQPPIPSGQPSQAQPGSFPPQQPQHQGAPGMATAMTPHHSAPPIIQNSVPGAINPEVASGFAQVLHVLQGSQVLPLPPATILLLSSCPPCDLPRSGIWKKPLLKRAP